MVSPHVLRTLEGAPILIAESKKLPEVNMVVRVVHLVREGGPPGGGRVCVCVLMFSMP